MHSIQLYLAIFNGIGLGEIAGAPEIPTGDGPPGSPLPGSTLHVGGFGEEVGCDLGGGLEALEGEGEPFADAVVGGGEDVGAAETEDEHHFDGPLANAADLGQMLDDCFVGHAADTGEGGDGAVEGFGGEVAEGESFVVGEAGGAQLGSGAVEEMLRRGVGRMAAWGEAAKRLEARDHACVNGGGGLAVELLIDDGFGEGFEGGLVGSEA